MKKIDYLSSLTSLRGIAALLIIIFHFDLIFFRLAAPNSPLFIRKGYLWVDFFFILSGFIMVHVYGELFSEKFKLRNFKQFIRARFARIYPLHLFSFLSVVVFYFWYRAHNVLNAMDAYTFNMKAILTNILLLHSMGFHRYLSWDTPSWSVSTEWWMYIIFPLILIPFNKILSRGKIYILFFIIAGYLFINYYLHPLSNAVSPFPNVTGINSIDVTYDYGFFRCFLGFLFGMLIYELYRVKWHQLNLSKNKPFLLVAFSVIIALSFKMPDFITVVLFGAILLMSTYATGIVKRLLNLKPLVYLGDISYSVYLMHMPILFFLLSGKNYLSVFNTNYAISWLYCFIYVVIVLTISTLTYNFIEKPMRQRINYHQLVRWWFLSCRLTTTRTS